jgi:hypothetical protein
VVVTCDVIRCIFELRHTEGFEDESGVDYASEEVESIHCEMVPTNRSVELGVRITVY